MYAGAHAAAAAEKTDAMGLPLHYGRVPEGKKVMEVLAPLDHSTIDYPPFRKKFYEVSTTT